MQASRLLKGMQARRLRHKGIAAPQGLKDAQFRGTMTNILIIGNGGREHALAWKMAQSPQADRVFVAPGNAGTDIEGENVAIRPGDFPALVKFAKENQVGLTVVGPEAPLAAGIVDAFEQPRAAHLRPKQGRRRARGQQGLLQGTAAERRRADGRLPDLPQRRGGDPLPRGPRRRAHRGEGRRPGGRQGRDRLLQPPGGPGRRREDRAAKRSSAPPGTGW